MLFVVGLQKSTVENELNWKFHTYLQENRKKIFFNKIQLRNLKNIFWKETETVKLGRKSS